MTSTRRASLLAVFAHPDDEIFHGGVLAHMAERGEGGRQDGPMGRGRACENRRCRHDRRPARHVLAAPLVSDRLRRRRNHHWAREPGRYR
mgnify:CR=1 FL=1